ncbi:MAG: hypothetical protein AMJ54_16150 [Deltaproteobacteria bacterium SG8_13]|nr:MAG: hypothetical protein AMJ54_16150 [Deltaproteobacteria bacterium SG8_13]
MNRPEFDLKAYLLERREKVNNQLDRILSQPAAPPRLADAMRYSVTAGGKRLRPILCIAACDAVGGAADDILAVACALEMIHSYSLIHDDLPAMDDDAIRRGKPTCHVAFDEATAILAGDALLTLAFQTLSGAGAAKPSNAAMWLRVIDVIAEAAGGSGMVGGQLLDMTAEGQPVDLPQLERMQRMKTGALIQASVQAGALMANADSEQIDHLAVYAANVGQAFQIADDVLNVEGDPSRLGKAVGSDAERSKSTYPSLLGLEASKILAREKIDQALNALTIFDNRAEPLRAIARYVIDRRR